MLEASTGKSAHAGWRAMRMAALEGSEAAQYVLALTYRHGGAFAQNAAQSFHWMREAALNGCQDALLELARMYFHGIGTKTDLEAARFWAQYASATWRYIFTGLRHADLRPLVEAIGRRWLLLRIMWSAGCLRLT